MAREADIGSLDPYWNIYCIRALNFCRARLLVVDM